MKTTLEGKNLILEIISLEDIPLLYPYTEDWELSKYMLWEANKTVESYKKVVLSTIDEIKGGSMYQWVIRLKNNREVVGIVNTYITDSILSSIFNKGTLWIWIALPFQRKWYAKEALLLVLYFSFNTLRLNKLMAYTFEKDIASNSLFKSVWFKKSWYQERELFKNNKWNNVCIYELLNPKI